MAILRGRVRVRYRYSRWGYTGTTARAGMAAATREGLDSTTFIRMPRL